MEVPTNRQGLGDPSLCKAFIIHRLSGLTYSDLAIWAKQTINLFGSSIYADQDDWTNGRDAAQLVMTLQAHRFNPKHDYIVLSGDILRIATTMMVIGRNWSPVTILRYDREYRGYWPFCVHVGNKRR